MRVIDVVRGVNDLASLAAVLPLLQQAVTSNSEEVPDEDVAAALATLDADRARVQGKVDALPDDPQQ